jgi:hypothetical protein
MRIGPLIGIIAVIAALALMWRAFATAPTCRCDKPECGGGCLKD